MDTDLDKTQSQTARPAAKRSKWALVVGLSIILVVAVVVGAVLFLQRKPASNGATNPVALPTMPAELTSMGRQVGFPLYYPSPLPQGLSFTSGSLQRQEGAVLYALSGQGIQFIVAEQAQPDMTEEIKKTAEFKTQAGNAYIADVGGRNTGFVQTGKTLIVVSGATNSQAVVLRQLLESFKPL